MPRLSIIIPVAGNLTSLEDTLLSVLENRPDGAEVLVVLDEPYDDPYELKGEIRFLEAAAGASFVESVNLGIKREPGPRGPPVSLRLPSDGRLDGSSRGGLR